MRLRNKQRWRIIKDYCIGWTLAFLFLSTVRGVGTMELGSIQFEFWESLIYSLVFGPVFGSISGFALIMAEERAYKKMSIQRLLVLRLVYAFLFLAFIVVVSFFVTTLSQDIEMGLWEFAIDAGSFAIYFYILVVDFCMVLIRQVNLMLGERKLLNLILGKYYTPHEEERIFMFLDLQSSTLLAERLGHIKYSLLIQDCFSDLSVVVENEAEIYQYVGDEVVLTWKLKEGLKNQNCIKAFYNFKRRIAKKEAYYLEKYGCLPFFKAGMNAGMVTVAEVGKYKKEIAYHGDTINTAARIQGQCNAFNQELLISQHLKEKLSEDNFSFEELGSIPLKGKEKEVSIYAVYEPNSIPQTEMVEL